MRCGWVSPGISLSVSPFLSHSFSCSSSCRLSFPPSLSLSNNGDALDRLEPSAEEGAMLGHLCVSMCVQAFIADVCVAVHEDSPCQRTEWASSVPLCIWAVAVIEVFSCKKKKKKKDWGEAGNCSCTGMPGLSHNFSPVGLRLGAGQCVRRMLRPTVCHR